MKPNTKGEAIRSCSCRQVILKQTFNYRRNNMSGDLLKILRSLKGHSDHDNHHSHHDHNGSYHDRYQPYDHHYKSHDRHFFSSLAFKVMRELSGKLIQNRRLVLPAIIALLAVAVVFLVCAAWLVVILIKLCGPLISDIEKNGLKGIVDTVSKILTRIWEGSGK